MQTMIANTGASLRNAVRAFTDVRLGQLLLAAAVLAAAVFGLVPQDGGTHSDLAGLALMVGSIQALREQRNVKAKEVRKLVDDHPGDKWNADCQAKYDSLVADIDQLDGEIERTQRVLDLDAQNAQRIQRRADNAGTSTDEAEHRLNQERDVFRAWLRGGPNALNAAQREFVEQRASDLRNQMGTQVPAEGGAVVPTDFMAQLLEELKAFGGVREVATTIGTTGGETIQWPTTDATAEEGELVDENQEVTDQDATFGTVGLKAFMFSSKGIAVPYQLLQDAFIDVEAHLRDRLVTRIGRITNKKFTIGSGVNEPKGILTAASLGKTGAAGQVASVTYDDLVDLEHSCDPAYRKSGNCRWMFHDQTLKALKKMKDGQGRPIWLPEDTGSMQSNAPGTILGYGYTINQDMPTMAAGAKPILFGCLNKYMVRDVRQVMFFRMTDSAYTRKAQVGFLAFSRHDGNLIDASDKAVRYYQNAVS